MKPIQTQAHYTKWLTAEQMHDDSKEWLSELNFIRDEHLFFIDLITTFTMQLVASKKFASNKEVIDTLNRSQKRNHSIIEAVKIHENQLQIMVDGVDELAKEKAYIKEHRDLIIVITEFLKEYQALKKQLFTIIKNIKKEEKQKRLIDRK
jgi:hypothetical protein